MNVRSENNHSDQDLCLKPLLTIGYGSERTCDELVKLLHSYGVTYLVDVRSKPFSKFRPEYSRDTLAAFLKRSGIVYVYMGDTLGGLPSDPTCYTDGKVQYREVREREWFAHGLARLVKGWHGGHHIALMCAELEPDRCHRTKLIGEALVATGVRVAHIDEKSSLATHEAVMARLNGSQPDLFNVEYTSRRMYSPGAGAKALEWVVTIGVYGFKSESFVAALQSAGVDLFVDIRARRGIRGSEYAFANALRLEAALAAAGIRYMHAKELAPSETVRDFQRAADVESGVAKRDR